MDEFTRFSFVAVLGAIIWDVVGGWLPDDCPLGIAGDSCTITVEEEYPSSVSGRGGR
jgi:hypothetical protein